MVFTIINVFEILIFNLLHTHLIAKKRYATHIVFIVLLIFTALLFTLIFFVGINENTTARSVLVGLVYVIPIYFLYDTNFRKLFTIMIYCWTYTLGVNSFAFGIANLINPSSVVILTLIIQSIVFAISFPFVMRFSRNKFKTILEKSNVTIQNLLNILGASIFSTFVCIRYFVDPSNATFLVILVFIGIIALTSYVLLHIHAVSTINLTSVREIAHKDTLTGIRNRYSFVSDIDLMISSNQEFVVLFMDLDNLKSVNDSFSHREGDKYLQEFASVLTRIIGSRGNSYRFAGDEFICLITNSLDSFSKAQFEQQVIDEMNKKFNFIGVSVGEASYPKNGLNAEELINSADKSMYIEKKKKTLKKQTTS